MAPPDPYAKSMFHGKLLDNATIAALKIAEERLGYELTITQGIGGAPASAGTHTEGRAVDLVFWDHKRKVRVLKDLGFAVWPRADLPGVWGEHIHAVLIFEKRSNSRGLAGSGFRQIGSYDRGRNGLANDGPDRSYRPDPKVSFTLANYRASFKKQIAAPDRTPITAARNRLAEALHATGQAVALLDGSASAQTVAQLEQIKDARKEIRAILKAMPKK